MLTLSFGFQKPQVNDAGDIVFPALEANIQQLNDHDHNGTNSKKLNAVDLDKTKINILAANWNLVADGHYTQNVTIPASKPYDDVTLFFRLSTGEQVSPSISKVSASVVKVDFDDNTQDLVCFIN